MQASYIGECHTTFSLWMTEVILLNGGSKIILYTWMN